MSDRGETLDAPVAARRYGVWIAFALAVVAFFTISLTEWHPDAHVRRATAIVGFTLILWISEAAPLGVTALFVPVLATISGILKWNDAVSAWGDSIVFLFLGAFLLARALDKHGAFDRIGTSKLAQRLAKGSGAGLTLLVLLGSAALSTVQNNTAVTAMLLPVVLPLAQRTRNAGIVLLALSYGATFGGMATPVGTAPNLQGYARMKEVDADHATFLAWMMVGLPVAIGAVLIGWMVLFLTARLGRAAKSSAVDEAIAPFVDTDVGPHRPEHPPTAVVADRARIPLTAACKVAIFAFVATAATWLFVGAVQARFPREDAFCVTVSTLIPDALPPIAAAVALFVIRTGRPARPILDRHDFQALDWDTLFLIAGGLCLGKVLDESGAAHSLAAFVAQGHPTPLALYLSLAAVTVLLSELTSNTATAALMIPIAHTLAPVVGEPAFRLIWLVALSASLGFALPISTPPNAIVYGTRKIPLRQMAVAGIITDLLSILWLVFCLRALT